jgi:hypothetical protein
MKLENPPAWTGRRCPQKVTYTNKDKPSDERNAVYRQSRRRRTLPELPASKSNLGSFILVMGAWAIGYPEQAGQQNVLIT